VAPLVASAATAQELARGFAAVLLAFLQEAAVLAAAWVAELAAARLVPYLVGVMAVPLGRAASGPWALAEPEVARAVLVERDLPRSAGQ
jgi:hypothetical protein